MRTNRLLSALRNLASFVTANPLMVVIFWVWLVEALLYAPLPALAPLAMWLLGPCALVAVAALRRKTKIIAGVVALASCVLYAVLYVHVYDTLVLVSQGAHNLREYLGRNIGGALGFELIFCTVWSLFWGFFVWSDQSSREPGLKPYRDTQDLYRQAGLKGEVE